MSIIDIFTERAKTTVDDQFFSCGCAVRIKLNEDKNGLVDMYCTASHQPCHCVIALLFYDALCLYSVEHLEVHRGII